MNPVAPPPLPRRKRYTWVWVVLVTVLVFFAASTAVLRWLATAPKPGAAAILTSPNSSFLAIARTETDEAFWGGQREFFEFTVSKHEIHLNDPSNPWRYQPDRTLVLNRIAGLPFPAERGTVASTIRWLPDSSEVTFDLQGASVSISTTGL